MNFLFLNSTDIKDSTYLRDGNKNLLQTKFGIGNSIATCGKVIEMQKTKYGIMITLNDGTDDTNNFIITVGTFNKNALQDAQEILKKFKNQKEIYLLIYSNPFCKGNKIYLNANQDFCIFEVDKKTFHEFHEMRKKAIEYLTQNISTEKANEERSNRKINGKKLETAKILTQKVEENNKAITKRKNEEEKYEEFEKNYFYDYMNVENIKNVEINKKIKKFVKDLSKGKEIEIDVIVKELKKLKFFKDMDINVIEHKIYEMMEEGYFYEPKPRYLKIVE